MDDWRLVAYEIACAKQRPGDAIIGLACLHHELAWAGFEVAVEEIQSLYRNLAELGILCRPTRRGEPYRVVMPYEFGQFILASKIRGGKSE